MGAPRFVMDDFWPSDLFLGGIPGAWYDPTDLSTMFQDSAGTTPVTAVEQPVGLILDKSQGLALGAELVTNGDFSGGTTGWTGSNATLSIVGGALRFTVTANGQAGAYQQIATTAGRTYKATFTFVADAANGNTFFNAGTTTTGAQLASINCGSTTGTYTMYFVATGAISYISVITSSTALAGQTNDVTGFTVRELAGNHAIQSTAASRPTYRARYNLLTYSEQFDNAAWTKGSLNTTGTPPWIDVTTAPDGTTTADRLIEAAAFGFPRVYGTAAVQAGTYTFTVYAKKVGGPKRWISLYPQIGTTAWAIFDIDVGIVTGTGGANYVSASVTPAGNQWFRCSLTFTCTTASVLPHVYVLDQSSNAAQAYTGDGSSGVYIWGAQLLTAADVTATGNAYQRIAAATVYDTAPVFRPYLAFDGMDDSLSTAAINFTSTDKLTTFSGLSKQANALGILTELSAQTNLNAGAFYISTNESSAGDFTFRITGTPLSPPSGGSTASVSVPVTQVLTSSLNQSGLTLAAQNAIRINTTATAYATTVGSPASGNFGNHPLFIGRRNNASFPFNGRLYSLIVRGAASSVTEIADTELWINARTGGY